MRAVVQRVTSARVAVDSRVVAAIEHGLLVLVGIARDDDATDTAYLANKIVGLRVFEDADHRFRSPPGKLTVTSRSTRPRRRSRPEPSMRRSPMRCVRTACLSRRGSFRRTWRSSP